MKKIFIFIAFISAFSAAAQPTLWGGAKLKFIQGDTAFSSTIGALKAWMGAGSGTITAVSVASANGFAGSSSGGATPALTLSTTVTGMLKGNGTAISAGTAGTDYSSGTAALATGILKSTTTTGGLTIAVAGDFPTLNQNTTGSAATLTTSRNINGVAFNGSADITVTAAAGTLTGTTLNSTVVSSSLTSVGTIATGVWNGTAIAAANGGTGQTTYAVGDILYASTSSALSKLADVATGNALISGGVTTAPSWGKIGLTTHVSGTLPVANGGTNLTSIGGDVTLLGSNGTANIYYALGITTTSAAIGFARSSSTLNLNIPDADASFRGTVSTGTQTMAGNKTWTGTQTVTGLVTGNGGIRGVATSSAAGLNAAGVYDADFVVVTANTTLDHTNNYLAVGTLSANITLGLPACSSTTDGWEYEFLKIGTDAFAFIIDPNSTETFADGATTKTIYSQGSGASCKCRSSNNTWLFRAK